jgi:hypothetical protein
MTTAFKRKPATAAQRGQHGWNPVPTWVDKTRFEIEVERLGMEDAPERMLVESKRLREFAKSIRNRHYVPEWLLEAWGITVIADREEMAG